MKIDRQLQGSSEGKDNNCFPSKSKSNANGGPRPAKLHGCRRRHVMARQPRFGRLAATTELQNNIAAPTYLSSFQRATPSWPPNSSMRSHTPNGRDRSGSNAASNRLRASMSALPRPQSRVCHCKQAMTCRIHIFPTKIKILTCITHRSLPSEQRNQPTTF